MAEGSSLQQVDVLGVPVHCGDLARLMSELSTGLARDERRVVVFLNLFCAMQQRRDPGYREALRAADWRLPDGMPVAWAARWLGGRGVRRVPGPDVFDALNAHAARAGLSVYFLGGAIPRNAERVAEAARRAFPGLRVAGTWSPPTGPVDGELAERIIADIARCRPDILWVGLGSPRQEAWIHRYRERLAARLTLAVGGTFNYYNGTRTRAPRWMCRWGLEWAHRVIQDPALFRQKRFFAFGHEFLWPVGRQVVQRWMRW